jgi:hypothetical protein
MVAAAWLAAALLVAPLPSFAAKIAARSGEKACRGAVNGLISLLDANTDGTPLYRDTFALVVNTCGPLAPAPNPKDPPRRLSRSRRGAGRPHRGREAQHRSLRQSARRLRANLPAALIRFRP